MASAGCQKRSKNRADASGNSCPTNRIGRTTAKRRMRTVNNPSPWMMVWSSRPKAIQMTMTSEIRKR